MVELERRIYVNNAMPTVLMLKFVTAVFIAVRRTRIDILHFELYIFLNYCVFIFVC